MAQCAPFVLWGQLDDNLKDLWLSLSKVNTIHVTLLAMHACTYAYLVDI